jgi:hypothetical protein
MAPGRGRNSNPDTLLIPDFHNSEITQLSKVSVGLWYPGDNPAFQKVVPQSSCPWDVWGTGIHLLIYPESLLPDSGYASGTAGYLLLAKPRISPR